MTNETHLVSVIIPFFNTKKELMDRCVESVIAQTSPNFECVIVDDGSADEYAAYLSEYEAKDSRIRVVHKANQGLGSTRNYGVEIANGEYVFFLDSDDYISPYTLKTGLEIICQKDADMVVGGLLHVKPEETPEFGESVKNTITIESKEEKKEYVLHLSGIKQSKYQLEQGNTGTSACSRLVKRDLVRTVRFEEDKYWDEDDIWNITFVHKCNRIVVADILWYAYVINPQSMVRGYAGDRTTEFQYRAKQEYSLIKELWPECMQGAYCHIWDGLLRYCRTDSFQSANPNPKAKRYKKFIKAIDFPEFTDSIQHIDFDFDKRLKFRIVKKTIRRLLLLRNKRMAYWALNICNRKIVF